MLVRYFLLAVLIFLLYWVIKGTFRRFFAPPRPQKRRRAAPEKRKEEVTEPNDRRPGIDYSKVKDANYRDLDR
jgi:hypothetical protein